MEKDLFPAVKAYFESLGYRCDGEVKGIDLYMEKDGESAAVELKQTFDFRVLQQAALRQKVADSVYIAIPRPKDLYARSGRDKQYLLKRLGIGLIVVSPKTGKAERVLDPVVSELSSFQKRNRSARESLEKEFRRRRMKQNTGGVNKTKLLTGYREDSLLVLDALSRLGGESTGKETSALSAVKTATRIMYENHYGWFENVRKGVYRISAKGTEALTEYAETILLLKESPAPETGGAPET